MKSELRPLWQKYFDLNWKFGLFLLLVLCVPRFILVLKANETGSYGLIGLVMFLSALIPFLFLSTSGQRKIGIKKTNKLNFLMLALILGIGLSLVLYFLGHTLYGDTFKNWYVYIGKSYNIPENISVEGRRSMFIIMAITGMIFSPFGEELFFRGIVHQSFANSLGVKKASLIDGAAFALVHLSHFGLVFINENWYLLYFPALLWMVAMFIVSLFFLQMKKRTESIWGAVICHSGFNLGMIYSIFYWL